MANSAITFRVTARARRQIAFSFPRMMLRSFWRIGPDRSRRVKAAARRGIAERRGPGDAGAFVTRQTKGLASMTTAAARIVLPRGLRMQTEPIIGVNR
jgi:hypothetical protein